LAMGGAGIVIGLMTYGYNVIKSIGMKLAKITPSRGFAIEMGSSIVVIIGSNLGIPLSTTHCQVGATVGVGMCEIKDMKHKSRGVNWNLMGKVIAMWILTIAFAGLFSASFFSFIVAVYHPMSKPMHCGPIAMKLNNTASLRPLTEDAMAARFTALDANGDKKLDSDELEAVGLDMDIKGEKKTVETYGRRRRRTPKTMDQADFLQFGCMKSSKLEHMQNQICEPQCEDGYRANKELACKLNPTTVSDEGSFLMGTGMSGFTKCVAVPV
jgi:sodium-dependent phosphate transporter